MLFVERAKAFVAEKLASMECCRLLDSTPFPCVEVEDSLVRNGVGNVLVDS